jgi:hypothetical protein
VTALVRRFVSIDVVVAAVSLGVVALYVDAAWRQWRHDDASIAVALLAGAACGLLARGPLGSAARDWRTAAVAVGAAAPCLYALVRWPATRLTAMDWRLLLQLAMLALGLALLGLRKRLSAFAVGAAAMLVLCAWWAPVSGLSFVAAFLVTRDAGAHDDGLPARQALAALGTGALALLLAVALSFDAGLSAIGPSTEAHIQLWIDPPSARWPRIALEAALLSACIAQTRGRSWGVVGQLALGPVLLFAALDTPLPFVSSGCIGSPHPLDDGTLLLAVPLVVSTAPWLLPLARRLRA